MADALFIIFENVVPAIGALLFIIMAASPTRAVWRTRRRSDIGEFNPLPTVVLIGNAVCWNVFAVVTSDPFITVSSSGGLLVAIFNTVILVGQARQRTRDRLLALLLCYVTFLLVLAALTSLAGWPQSTKELLWGMAANAGSILYYTSPLATVMKVVRQKDSASIHAGNAIMSIVNCALWIIYFVAQGKAIIPTLTYYIGVSFNLVCLWLCWRYSRRKHEPEEVETELQPSVADAAFAATHIGGATSCLARPSWSAEAGAPASPEEQRMTGTAPCMGRSDGGPVHRARGALQRSSPPTGIARLSSGAAKMHAAEGGRTSAVDGERKQAGDGTPATPPAAQLNCAASGPGGS